MNNQRRVKLLIFVGTKQKNKSGGSVWSATYLKGQAGELQAHAKGQERGEEERDTLVAAVFGPAVTLYIWRADIKFIIQHRQCVHRPVELCVLDAIDFPRSLI